MKGSTGAPGVILGSHWAPPTLTSHPSRRVLETSQLQAGVCRLLPWSPEADTHTQKKAHSRLVVPEEGADSGGFWPHSLAWGAGDSYESSRLPTRLQHASLQSPSLQSEEGDLSGPNAAGPDPWSFSCLSGIPGQPLPIWLCVPGQPTQPLCAIER